MNLRVALYEKLVNERLLVRVLDLDNEGGRGTIKVFVSGLQQAIEVNIDHLSLSPLDVFISQTPITGSIHKVTAKLYAGDHIALHDTDTKMIKLGT